MKIKNKHLTSNLNLESCFFYFLITQYCSSLWPLITYSLPSAVFMLVSPPKDYYHFIRFNHCLHILFSKRLQQQQKVDQRESKDNIIKSKIVIQKVIIYSFDLSSWGMARVGNSALQFHKQSLWIKQVPKNKRRSDWLVQGSNQNYNSYMKMVCDQSEPLHAPHSPCMH